MQEQCVDTDPHISSLILMLDPDPFSIQEGENDAQKAIKLRNLMFSGNVANLNTSMVSGTLWRTVNGEVNRIMKESRAYNYEQKNI